MGYKSGGFCFKPGKKSSSKVVANLVYLGCKVDTW